MTYLLRRKVFYKKRRDLKNPVATFIYDVDDAS